MNYKFYLKVLFLLLVTASSACAVNRRNGNAVASPGGKIQVTFYNEDGGIFYSVKKDNVVLVDHSRMGFVLKDAPSLNGGFRVLSRKVTSFDETWEQPWGEVKQIRNRYNCLRISLQEKNKLRRKMDVIFKVYDDGLGFRYEIPEQPGLKDFVIMDELTEFSMSKDFNAWWIPAFGKTQDSEYIFKKDKLSALKENVHTPLTMEFNDTLFVSIHEAGLIDYASATLKPAGSTTLKCDLVPWADGDRVKTSAPMKTPWRTLQIAGSAGDLITSYLVLNLNDPNKLKDLSYVKPGKYTGIWWGMHMNTLTWAAGPQHGATTDNVKRLIDFSKEHHIQGVLAEGWNEGWEGDWVKEGKFNFTRPYPDFDIAELSRYAASKGVTLISHHETGGNVLNYESQLDTAFSFLEKNDIHAVKTGYVNTRINGKEYHQGQYMVNHYQRVMETAARHKVMIDVHEPIKDTGLRRTFPNMMTREGVRGTEYEAWSEGNPPSHTAILPFTRGLAGPIDYTPGIFNILFKNQNGYRVHTTLAKQLALYVVIYSPLQMAADLTENYEGQKAFKFIEDVPTDWEFTKVLNGRIGEFITVVRKDRSSNDWYMGSITNEEARHFEFKLDFLTPGKRYVAEVYADGKDADFEKNPLPLVMSSEELDSSGTLKVNLAPGGGQAIRFRAL